MTNPPVVPLSEPLEPFGDFPPQLFRAFTEERWARAFVEEGRLRFWPVQHFVDLEDPLRADPSEGSAHLQIRGDVTAVHIGSDGQVRLTEESGYINFQSSFVNPVFIYCFSYPPDGDVQRLPRKFGDFVVRIDDPRQLARDVTRQMTNDGILRETPVVECHRVSYNKGMKEEVSPDHFTRTRLNYTQKPVSFSGEYEYRFASVDCRGVRNRNLSAEAYEVVIGRPLPYASLFTR
jgi:hypothetical protein